MNEHHVCAALQCKYSTRLLKQDEVLRQKLLVDGCSVLADLSCPDFDYRYDYSKYVAPD